MSKKAKIASAVSVFVSAVAIACYLICTITNYWVIIDDREKYIHYGLWQYCVDGKETSWCDSLTGEQLTDFVKGTRLLMIISCITSAITWFIACIAVVRQITEAECLECAQIFGTVVTGIVFIVAVVVAVGGLILYTVGTSYEYEDTEMDYSIGYSLICGWLGVPTGIIGGIFLICFIHKTKE